MKSYVLHFKNRNKTIGLCTTLYYKVIFEMDRLYIYIYILLCVAYAF